MTGGCEGGARPAVGADGWCELHCHSGFSLLDGAAQPEALAMRAADLGYPALALTDHDSLAGLIRHAQACASVGVRPIAGCELTLSDGGHLTFLARDAVGYRSLASLVSRAHLAGAKGQPCATLDDVAAHTAGLECLTGCRRGPVAAAVLRDDSDGAAAALARLRDIFGPRHLWVEVQRAWLPDDNRLHYELGRLARRAGLPLVATGNAHYARAEDRDLQDVLVCLRERVPIARARPHLRPGAPWRLRSGDEMARAFAHLPAAVRGAAELAARCAFSPDHVDTAFPAFPAPAGHTSDSYLAALVRDGARARYGDAAPAELPGRLRHELATIAHLGLADYVLVVWDIVRFARARGILVQGRGSAVGSVVAYCLGLTAVEPLHHRLSFDRFLSVGRTDPPDIDLDLPADRPGHPPAREAVIQYALARWADHAALVANVVTFQARLIAREVGMALGLDPAQVAALAAAEPTPAVARVPDPRAGTPLARRVASLCQRLEGLPQHLSQHPGGIVVTARPLGEVVPVERARMEGRIVVQWDKDSIEGAGMAKIDLLGLGMLGVIDACFDLVARQAGQRPALHGFRCDDPAVYALLCASDTVGLFQVESRAQMVASLPHLQPRCYEDLIVSVALIRPGPIQGGAVHPYLRRRRGLEPVTYPGGAVGARLLAPILAETLGVCLYQDQVIDIGRACGLDAGEAAELRRAMSSTRDQGRMLALRGRLETGLAAHGLDAAARGQVVAMVEAFSGYGFVKGHAAAFAYLAYVSAWLKVHHPAAFYAALLNLQPMGFYSPEVLVQDAGRHGVRVLPVDVRHSDVDTAPEGEDGLRLGLRLIRGLGAEACARIVAALSDARRPRDPEELCRRASLREDEARALARSGAMRGYIGERRQALWRASVAARAAREGWLPGLVAAADGPVALPPASRADEMALDRAALGFSPDAHALAPLRERLPGRLARSRDLPRLATGATIELVGQVVSRQSPGTAKGVVFLTLSDEWGLMNVVAPRATRERTAPATWGETLIWVGGVVERGGRALTVRATDIRPLTALLP